MVIPKRMIVAWRSTNFKETDPDSVLVLEFSKVAGGARINLVHIVVPAEDHKGVSQGWPKYYWKPWKAIWQRGSERPEIDHISSWAKFFRQEVYPGGPSGKVVNYAVTADAGKSIASSLGSTASAASSAVGDITRPLPRLALSRFPRHPPDPAPVWLLQEHFHQDR